MCCYKCPSCLGETNNHIVNIPVLLTVMYSESQNDLFLINLYFSMSREPVVSSRGNYYTKQFSYHFSLLVARILR